MWQTATSVNADPASAQQAEGASDVPQAGTTRASELKNENAALKAELAALKAISRNNRADKKAVFAKGDICIIQGLVNQPLYNDHIARILSHDPARAIWNATIVDGTLDGAVRQLDPSLPRKVQLKAANLVKPKVPVTLKSRPQTMRSSGTTQRAIAASSGSPGRKAPVERRAAQAKSTEKATTGADGKSGRTDRTKPRTFRGSPTTWSQKQKQSWEGRTTSPTGRAHPNAERRNDVRKADLHASINYYATTRVPDKFASTGDPVYEAPDNDRNMKEASFLQSQAWFESLRHYPKGKNAIDSEAAYSGLTHGANVPSEHLETDVRQRLGIAVADPVWLPTQLQEAWVPEQDRKLAKKLAAQRARLRGVSPDHPDVAEPGSETGPALWA